MTDNTLQQAEQGRVCHHLRRTNKHKILTKYKGKYVHNIKVLTALYNSTVAKE